MTNMAPEKSHVWKVDGRKVWIASHFTGSEPFSSYVIVEPHPVEGVVVVGLNGAQMVVLHDPDGVAWARLGVKVPYDVAKRLRDGTQLQTTSAGVVKIYKTADASRAIYESTAETAVETKLPSWSNMVPTITTAEIGSRLDLEKLAAFSYLWGAPTKTVVRSAHFRAAADGRVLIIPQDLRDRFGMLMPLRGTLEVLPEFMYRFLDTDSAPASDPDLDDPPDYLSDPDEWALPPPKGETS